jgi:hypothetical protein
MSVVILSVSMVLAATASAQDTRLTRRLDPTTAAAISRIVDSARVDGLPTEPLVAKALEGPIKGVPGDRIVVVVRAFADALRSARRALGTSATEPEIVAAASAVISGVEPAVIAKLRSTRPAVPLTMHLVILADLVSRGVPRDTAAGAVYSAARAGLSDAQITSFWKLIEADIAKGIRPAAATVQRARLIPGGNRFERIGGDAAPVRDPLRPPGAIPP